jgi:hypothetical protein
VQEQEEMLSLEQLRLLSGMATHTQGAGETKDHGKGGSVLAIRRHS